MKQKLLFYLQVFMQFYSASGSHAERETTEAAWHQIGYHISHCLLLNHNAFTYLYATYTLIERLGVALFAYFTNKLDTV